MRTLSAALERPITVVRAPAGYGKTVAVQQLLDAIDADTAWIACEPGGPPHRCWAQIVAALDAVGLDTSAARLSVERGPLARGPEDLLVNLAHDIARLSRPIVVVLDDFHLLGCPDFPRQLDFLARRLPDLLRFVLVGRGELGLPIVRWQAHGLTSDIDRASLRLDDEEAALLVAALDGTVPPAPGIESINDRAEGWPLGVQFLAASHRRGNGSQGFDSDLAGQLVGRLLAGTSEELQEFVLATSVLGRFTVELATVVTGRDDAGRLVREALQADLLIEPFAGNERWFRYQRLFAELMRWELQRRHPGRVRAIDADAVRWYEQRQDAEGVLRHSLAAGQLDQAMAFVADDTYRPWRAASFVDVDWASMLPESWLEQDPARMLAYVRLLGRGGRIDEARRWIERAEAELWSHPPDDPRQGLLRVAKALWHAAHLDADRTIRLVEATIDDPGSGPGAAMRRQRLLVAAIDARLLVDDVDGALVDLEIAAELDVSVNTVKSHLRALYRKLGAQSRDEAVRAARRAGLL